MNQEKRISKTKRRISLGSLCGMSALLLSIVCCVALVHVEFRIQEHHRLLSNPTTICDQMEEEILRKIQHNFNRWAAKTEEKLSEGKGKFGIVILFPPSCNEDSYRLNVFSFNRGRIFFMQNNRK